MLDKLQQLFTQIHYSPDGTNDKNNELVAFDLFIDLLHACEGKDNTKILSSNKKCFFYI